MIQSSKNKLLFKCCTIALCLILYSCQVNKKKTDPYKHLTPFKLCNDSKHNVQILDPYASIESIRIASERSFSGDTLMIKMITDALIQNPYQNSPKYEDGLPKDSKRDLSPKECMTLYLELTDIEKTRMLSMEKLYIKMWVFDKIQCFIANSPADSSLSDGPKYMARLNLCH